MSKSEDYEVIIVGAGVAGASASYHLTVSGVKNILVIDQGIMPGEGCDPKSGSAIMSAAPVIKMMVQIFACSSSTFVSHHGEEGAKRYLQATAEGLKLQKELAASMLQANQIQELGSFYIGYETDEEELRAEFETLKELGCEHMEWFDKEFLSSVEGCPSDFHCAIFFPRDGIIDSSSYAKGLLSHCEDHGSIRVMMNTHVKSVTEEKGSAVVELASGTVLRSKHVVMATGGLSQVPELCGILKPCYSYLVHVPVDHQCETSANFFTWGFSHDWCFANGKVRTSGEDHFSAYKDPKTAERCKNLIQWTLEKYGCDPLASFDDIPQQHGVYSETSDYVPLIGSFQDGRHVCYLVGCNAWGQTVLSYTSSLVPALLGYKELTKSQRDSMKLFSIRRFSHLPRAVK